jgi:hypothetical protein
MATIKFSYRTPDNFSARKAPDSVPPTTASANDGGPSEEINPVKVDRWWRESSFDLWHGLEVREDAPDTIPAEWLDEFDLP